MEKTMTSLQAFLPFLPRAPKFPLPLPPFNACHAGYPIYKSGGQSDPANYRGISLGASSPGRFGGGREKEGELPTTSVEFEHLLRTNRCEMLIGEDDISNDVITLGSYFSMFVYIRTLFRFALIGGNLTAKSTGSHRKIGGGLQIQET